MNTLTIKKTGLLLLFVCTLLAQFFVYKIWRSDTYLQNNINQNAASFLKPNQSLVLSNLATKNYLEAGNHFNEYIQNHNPIYLKKYQLSLDSMAVYLDSLNYLSSTNRDFFVVIKNKKQIELEVITLKKALDQLINQKIDTDKKGLNATLFIKKFNYEKILSSITYDTIKKITETKKKSLFGRIGNALKGKSDVNKQEVQSIIKMVFNNQEKSGTFEDQLRNTFLLTEKYYINNLERIKHTYNSLKNKDQELLNINKKIQDKSQKLILAYSKSAQEASRKKFNQAIQVYSIENSRHKKSIFYLLILMSAATVILILYTIYAYLNENKLAKAKATAEKNLDIKNQLIGMLSHEMRAPLNIIATFSEKLKLQNLNRELKPTIDSLHFAASSLQNTVNQILDFLKNEQSKLKLYNSKINLYHEIKSLLESLQSLSEVKKIIIIPNINSSTNTEVWADHVKIHQLFYNIIINAIKFTNEGTITVTVDLTRQPNKYRLDVSIIDTGIGIPQEDLKKVFNQFYQSKSHEKQMSSGAGLGLNLCKNIVDLYDGKITIDSILDQGTTISFYLLLDIPTVDQETFELKLTRKFKDKKIKTAVIDDDPITLQIIQKLITSIGFEVFLFERAPALQDFLNKNTVDVIISDMQIFDYTGIELSKDIKALKNQNSSKPIIALSGDTYLDSIEVKEIGFDDLIIKPINKEEFYQKLYNLL
ncbi:ATP-binding response regulator [Flavobacterium sp. TSSA_36]|uniref:ATP-binding response regulator n=1 Tax=Flavobacterium sp. TSSA_36 TaxID=3447669 RepID=UPI003F2A4819